MSELRYYQPTIESFHVGFRYEQLGSKNVWYKHTATPTTPLYFISDSIEEGNIRVRHLDAEEIVGCGWELEDTDSGCFYKMVHKGIKLTLCHLETRLEIYEDDMGNGDEFLFQGYIKNALVLKQVMEMLGIGV